VSGSRVRLSDTPTKKLIFRKEPPSLSSSSVPLVWIEYVDCQILNVVLLLQRDDVLKKVQPGKRRLPALKAECTALRCICTATFLTIAFMVSSFIIAIRTERFGFPPRHD
jgi:hypothetical protein